RAALVARGARRVDAQAPRAAPPLACHRRSLAREKEQSVSGIVAFDVDFDLCANCRWSLRELQEGQNSAAATARHVAEYIRPVNADYARDLLAFALAFRRLPALLGRVAVHLSFGNAAHRLLQFALNFCVEVFQSGPTSIVLLVFERTHGARGAWRSGLIGGGRNLRFFCIGHIFVPNPFLFSFPFPIPAQARI